MYKRQALGRTIVGKQVNVANSVKTPNESLESDLLFYTVYEEALTDLSLAVEFSYCIEAQGE